MNNKRIYLIGMPGCGKSTEGKQLAKHLGWVFIDLDHFIEEQEGVSIENIFANKGELYFRKIEKAALQKTFELNHTIIACGGGTIAFEDNMKQINFYGASIYLKASNNFLLSRIKASKSLRPLFLGLSEENILRKIAELGVKRASYFSLAHATFEVPLEGGKVLIQKACRQFNISHL